MLDRLTSMAVFADAAATGSFAGAADRLGISPQMVAKHVATLERQLGMRLLNRTTRKQSLTEFGRLYLDRCHAILAEVAEADNLAQTINEAPRGRLRVNAPVTFGRYALTPVITRFLREYPEVEVDLTLSDSVVNPVEHGYEVIVRIGPIDESMPMIARPLAPYRLIACAAPSWLEKFGEPQVPSDLANHECIGFSPWPTSLNRRWRFSRHGRTCDVVVNSRLNLNDWSAIHSAALDGFGIILGYERALAADLAQGRLVRVLPEYEGPLRPLHVLYGNDQRTTPKVRRFVEMLVDRFPASATSARP